MKPSEYICEEDFPGESLRSSFLCRDSDSLGGMVGGWTWWSWSSFPTSVIFVPWAGAFLPHFLPFLPQGHPSIQGMGYPRSSELTPLYSWHREKWKTCGKFVMGSLFSDIIDLEQPLMECGIFWTSVMHIFWTLESSTELAVGLELQFIMDLSRKGVLNRRAQFKASTGWFCRICPSGTAFRGRQSGSSTCLHQEMWTENGNEWFLSTFPDALSQEESWVRAGRGQRWNDENREKEQAEKAGISFLCFIPLCWGTEPLGKLGFPGTPGFPELLRAHGAGTQASCLLFAPTRQSHFSCSNTLQLLLFGCAFWCWLLFYPLHLQLLLLHAAKSSGISPDTLTAGAAPMQISAGSACLSSQTVWHYNCLVLIFPLPRLSICFQFLHLLGWLRYPTGFCPRHPLLHLLCSQLWNTGTLKHFYKQDSITGLFCLPEILAGTQESFHLYLLHASLAVKLVIAALHKSEFFVQFSGEECAVSVQCHGTRWANGQGGGEHLKKGLWRWWILHNSPAFPVVNLENYFGTWWEEARFQKAGFNSGANKLESHG